MKIKPAELRKRFEAWWAGDLTHGGPWRGYENTHTAAAWYAVQLGTQLDTEAAQCFLLRRGMHPMLVAGLLEVEVPDDLH